MRLSWQRPEIAEALEEGFVLREYTPSRKWIAVPINAELPTGEVIELPPETRLVRRRE